MRIFRRFFAFFVLLAAALPAPALSNAADVPHLHVQLVFPEAQLWPNGSDRAGLYFKLEPGWHVYWQNPGDSGEPPQIRWTLPEGVAAVPMQFPAPKRLPLGPLMDFGYEGEVLFPMKFEVARSANPGTQLLHAKVDWLVCREVCIPGKAELEASVQLVSAAPAVSSISAADEALWRRLAHSLPQPLPKPGKAVFQATSAGFRLSIETGQPESAAEFFPEDRDTVDYPAAQRATPTATGIVLDLKKDGNLKTAPAQLRGVVELARGRAFEIAAQPGRVAAPDAGALADSGAAAAQVSEGATAPELGVASSAKPETATTPSSPAGSPAPTEERGWMPLLRATGLAFLGGLLLNLMPCVFPVLFLKGLALVNSGTEERSKLRAHGAIYTAGILASFWLLVAVLLGLRAAGSGLGWGFQFQSPVFLSLMAGLLFFLGLSLAGQFEIGLTLTSAGGSLAQRQGYTGSFFTGVLAVVVATPCTAPFMGAAIGYALAQPAAVTFAVFTALALGLAAPYAALTLQPAWTRLLPRPGVWMEILRQATAVPIFGTAIWLAWVLAQAYGANALATLLASFLLLAIAGWFLGRWPAKRWAIVVAATVLLCAIALAFFGQRMAQGSPVSTAATGMAGSGSVAQGAWQPWAAEAVEKYRAQGRPVFVDFTASWCLSCQVNERVALQRPEVLTAFRAGNVALLKADWTQRDEAIGQALARLGRSGVPAYALYLPGESGPRLLPEVLTQRIVLDALAKLPKTEIPRDR
jgi:thiol:disulfide interchange protein